MITIKNSILFIFNSFMTFVLFSFVHAQTTENNSIKISDCSGAIALSKSGGHNIAFPGTKGNVDDIVNYQQKLKHPEMNSVWFRFKAPFSGNINITALAKNTSFEMAMFLPSNVECSDVTTGNAKMIYNTFVKDGSFSLESSEFSFLELKEGQLVTFMFNSPEEHNNRLDLTIDFLPLNHAETVKELMNVSDLRRDETLPTYRIGVRDAITQLPVDAKIIIKESRYFDAFYNASDLLLSLERTLKFDLSVDAYGYFPADSSIRIREISESIETIIELIPVLKGSQLKLEGIGFMPQTDVLTEEAKIKIQRLRDFMALNSSVEIEIHGHVHSIGSNTLGAQRLSSKRAKRVMNYLIDAGIEKSRMTHVGFGNSEMLFPEPKSREEEQANRRVEIKIVSIGDEE